MGNVARPNRNSLNKWWQVEAGDGKGGRAVPLCAELCCRLSQTSQRRRRVRCCPVVLPFVTAPIEIAAGQAKVGA